MSGVVLSTPAAHALCAALLVADGAARAWRLRVFVRAFGGSLRLWDAARANLMEDAAAAVTPMRLGGQPARLAVLTRAGVGTGAAIVASVVEAAIMYPIVIVVAAGVALAFAPEWWRRMSAGLGPAAVDAGRWLAAGIAVAVIAWITMRRVLPHRHHAVNRTIVHAWRELRRLDPGRVLLTSVLTLASVAARVAILPVLALTLASPPPLGPVILGSFVLLYGQLLLPTPSGAGAVEVGFLSGGAGVIGASTAPLLLAWRIYTSLISIAAGLVLAAASMIGALVRRRAPRATDVSNGVANP